MFNSEEDIFSLVDDLSSSYVDTDKLISSYEPNKFPVGMDNFRQKENINPLFKSPQFTRTNSVSPQQLARMRWKSAALKCKLIKDPWADFKLDLYPTEVCVRHRYNAIKKQWVTDECVVKVEPKQFANGAMRACFRCKKLSNLLHTACWVRAGNHVAKSYMLSAEFTRDDYFNDVKLQMDAKLWAEIYNRHNPPKKIDMFQMSVLEFKDGRLFHLEHFIEGKYIKYNSNSGFVEDVCVRNTPQAFSHFTFESSHHELIVVDVQGVGDLYTDPQIHTSRGTEYGEGNLGIKGMALFFSTHICNDVCRSLGLSQFDLAQPEFISHTKSLNQVQKSCLTSFRHYDDLSSMSSSPTNSDTRSSRQRIFSETFSVCSDISESEGYESGPVSPISLNPTFSIPIPMVQALRCQGRVRTESHCLDSAFSMDEAFNYFNSKKKLQTMRPSCIESDRYVSSSSTGDDDTGDCEEECVLGRVHLELARYHSLGRFCKDVYEECDVGTSFFHVEQAAKLGVVEAMRSVANIYLQQPNDLLSDFCLEDTEARRESGFEYLIDCADRGDKNSMLSVAKMLDTGDRLAKNACRDWLKSLEYYQRIVNASSDSDCEDSESNVLVDECEAIYLIIARMAEMNLKGGFSLEVDASEAFSLYNDAAEKAMSSGKGRLANKYYEMAEEASALCDEEEF